MKNVKKGKSLFLFKNNLSHIFRIGIECITFKFQVFGLYKGIMSPLYGQIGINAIVFGIYGNTMRLMGDKNLTSQFIAGATAGGVQSILASPMELVKIRFQMQGEGVQKLDLTKRDMRYHYTSPYDCFKKIYKYEGGIRGIFRGFNMTFWREVPSFGVYFASYHYLCVKTNAVTDDSVNIPKLLFCGGWAGIICWIVTYPTDVIKTRQQMDGMGGMQEYKGVIDCAMKSYRKEGLSVLFRGLNVTILRAFPTNAATLATVTVFLNVFGKNM